MLEQIINISLNQILICPEDATWSETYKSNKMLNSSTSLFLTALIHTCICAVRGNTLSGNETDSRIDRTCCTSNGECNECVCVCVCVCVFNCPHKDS